MAAYHQLQWERMRAQEIQDESKELSEFIMKFAAVRASPGVVSIVTHDALELEDLLPEIRPTNEAIFYGCGMIVECQIETASSSSSSSYICKVLAPASLFHRPNHVDLHSIKIDVFSLTTELYNATLLDFDFHYNLAVITFKTKTPLPTVTFKGIDDVFPIHPADLNPLFQRSPLLPDSNLFKILPGSQLFSLHRDHNSPYLIYPASGYFSSDCPEGFECNELYKIIDGTCSDYDGGPVINPFGEIIGIIFNSFCFLPSNILTRWWKHFKTTGNFRRPFLGLNVDNLLDADINYLALVTTKFPNISAGVIVTKVEEGSPAWFLGIQIEDIIVKLDGQEVKSKLKFFETIWDKDEKVVEFNVLRVINGEEMDLSLSLVIEEASPDKFHQWTEPGWEGI